MKKNISFNKIVKLRAELQLKSTEILEYIYSDTELETLDYLWENNEFIRRAYIDATKVGNDLYKHLQNVRKRGLIKK